MNDNNTTETTIPIASDLGFWGVAGLSGFAIAWFIFVFWVAWQMFRAHRIVPKELEGIRIALERIAHQLENKD